ncbi:MAG TPA: electron transfer flavoprotein subunit beta/FixA family protein [Rhodothermales bacterium]
MDIVVCIKRVPDLSEVEVAIDSSRTRIKDDDLVYGLNEWDRFAVEEALQLKEIHGGNVTVVTVGGEDADDVLRRALAMGADEAIRLDDPGFLGADGYVTARILSAAISNRPFDLILTGSVSSDSGSGVVGGMVAALLDIPQVALATSIEIQNGKALIQHEVETSLERLVEVDLPALVTVQTGINEPRYVSIRGIRLVAGAAIPVLDGQSIGLDAAALASRWVNLEEMSLPPTGGGAEILQGRTEEVVDQLIDRLKTQGAI